MVGAPRPFAAGARVFVPSTVTGEQLEYFLPVPISTIQLGSIASSHFAAACSESQTTIVPLAAIAALRGRTMLSIETLASTRAFLSLADAWFGKRIDIRMLSSLHSKISGCSSPASFRDSVVWVDGLRPKDAALIPCPPSMVPVLLEDYFAFIARTDVSNWVRLALGYYQLLMIHPFFDGNGRLSRLVSLVHGERFMPRSQAMAIAAALALQRRALRPVLDKMRQGDLQGYLEYWSKLLSWSETVMEKVTRFANEAKRSVMSKLDSSESSRRFARFVLDEPLFAEQTLGDNLNTSRKLTRTKVDALLDSGAIEIHGSEGKNYYRSPAAVEFWRCSMESVAKSCAELLPTAVHVTTQSP